jgi:hypothetical protein
MLTWTACKARFGFTLAALAAASALLSGCVKDTFTAIEPARAAVCDPVRISGNINPYGTLSVLWFNGVKDPAAVVKPDPLAGNKLAVFTTVPEGAATGPVELTVVVGGAIVLGFQGADQKLDFTVTGSPAPAAISQFGPPNQTIVQGQSATLAWTLSGAPPMALTLNGTSVLGQTSQTVSPTATTTYTLTAKNSCILRKAGPITVTVQPAIQLQLAPTAILVPRGGSATVTASVLADSHPINLSCSAGTGLGCTSSPIPAMATSGPITVSAAVSAPLGKKTLTVTAAEAAPGALKSMAPLDVIVVPAAGAFSTVTSTVGTSGALSGPAPTPKAGCTAAIVSGTAAAVPNKYATTLACGASHETIGYDIGGPPQNGGVGFSPGGALAVVTTWNPGGAPTPSVGFLPVLLPSGVVPSPTPTSQTVFVLAPSATKPPPAPQYMASPDGTLGIAIGANTASGSMASGVLGLYDNATHTLLKGGVTFVPGTPITAAVTHQAAGFTVKVMQGATTVMSYP